MAKPDERLMAGLIARRLPSVNAAI